MFVYPSCLCRGNAVGLSSMYRMWSLQGYKLIPRMPSAYKHIPYTPSYRRQKMCAVSVHVSLDKWVFTLNPSMKYHCWKPAMDHFYKEIVLRLITSSTKETNKAVKIKMPTICHWIWSQTNSPVPGIGSNIIISVPCFFSPLFIDTQFFTDIHTWKLPSIVWSASHWAAVRVKALTQGHLSGGNEGGTSTAFHFPRTNLSCWSGGLKQWPTSHKLTSLNFRPTLLQWGGCLLTSEWQSLLTYF